MGNTHGGGLLGAGVVLATLAGVWLWLAMLAGPWDLASGLMDARAHLDKAERSLSKGQIKQASYETLAAVASARRAREGLASSGPVMDLLRALPPIGDALDETDHLVRAAELSAEAARGTLEVAESALRGPDKIIERDPENPTENARIRLDRIEAIGATLSAARADVQGARRELEAVDARKLPKRFRDDLADGIERAGRTDELLADAEAGFAILPGFLGADGPRTYLIGMQNSAEERGTGGSILQFAPLEIVDGRPSLPRGKKASFSVYNVDRDRRLFEIDLPDDAWLVREVPDAHRFGNANWSPDWPLSADLLLRYANAAEPSFPEIDGVIAVDPFLLKYLIPGTGKFTTNYGNVISTQRAVPFLLNKAYAAFPVTSIRRTVLSFVVDRFYEGMVKPEHPTELVQGFGKALAEKHMQVWLRDPKEQAFIERMDWDGGLDEADGADYLNVVEQNVGGNKLDYFQHQTHTLDVSFDGDDALDSATVEITNATYLPQPRYVMGDSGGLRHGLTRPMMTVYAPGSAQFLTADVDGNRVALGQSDVATWLGDRPPEYLEVGKKAWPVALEIPIGETQSFRYDYRVVDVVRTEGSRRVYRLVVQHQPKVNPETLVIRIKVPDTATNVKARGFERRGDMLVYETVVRTDFELEVSWQT
jgi:hypothetical protein